MQDIYNSDLQDQVFTLENDSNFIKECEELAEAMAVSLFKCRKQNSVHPDLVVSFSWNQFLSYSVKEMAQARFGDIIHKHLAKNDLLNVCGVSTLSSHFITYYVDEIKLGNFLPKQKDLNILEDVEQGKTKAQTSRDHDVSVYYVNKVLDRVGLETYKRIKRVMDGEKYQDVMSMCINSHNPILKACQIDDKFK